MAFELYPPVGIGLIAGCLVHECAFENSRGGHLENVVLLSQFVDACHDQRPFLQPVSYYGPMNQILVRSGVLSEAVDFIRNPTAMRSLVIFIQTWMWFGWTTIIIMAAMTSISVSIYEAALADGANGLANVSLYLPPPDQARAGVRARHLAGWRCRCRSLPLSSHRWEG